MKIIILGPAHPFRGGIATFNDRLAQEFIKENYEVQIVNFTVQYPNILFPGKTQFTDSNPPEGVYIVRKLNSVNPVSWHKTANYIIGQKPDMLLVRYWLPFMAPCLGTVAKIVRKKTNTKIISLVDNIIPHEHHTGDMLLSNYFVRQIGGFVVMSKAVENDLRKFDKTKPIKFNPHPLYDHFGTYVSRQEALKHLGLSEEYRYILFFGLIRNYKGLDILLEAINNDDIKSKKIKLIVAGEFYADEEKYRKYISKNNLEDNVIVRSEYIPDEEVKYYFGASDVVVQPYKTATQSGITQIAYHFEKPMIVTNVGGLPEIVPDGKCGYVVEPNAQAVREAIIKFFNYSDYDYFAKNIKFEKQKYSWEQMVNTIISLYEEL